jgi:hypothetical protein
MSVKIMATTPPELAIQGYTCVVCRDYDSFNAIGDTLYVPKGCKKAYEADASWRTAFTNIVEQR